MANLKSFIRFYTVSLFGDMALCRLSAFAGKHSEEHLHKSDFPAGQRKILVFNCPEHRNLGDQAIAYAEKSFIAENSNLPVKMFSGTAKRVIDALPSYVSDEDIICLHGGGNMGTLYENEEYDRQLIISSFPNNRIIIFPQTVTFDSSRGSMRLLNRTKRIYRSHSDLHIIAREQGSYDMLKKYYPNVDIRLTPDIVLSLDPSAFEFASERKGVLLCLRNDKEKALSDELLSVVIRILQSNYSFVKYTDTLASGLNQGEYLSPYDGEIQFKKKLKELSGAELVITDRIHGMIFCALSGTPCIAIDNTNGKVGREYKWLSSLPYITFANNIDAVIEMLKNHDLKPGSFPFEQYRPLFDPLVELLANGACNG